MDRQHLGRLPIPLRPLLDFVASKRGLQVVTRQPKGLERSIYETLDPGAPVTTILDVGANVGATAIASAASFPGATVYAFEPSPTTFVLLREATAGQPRIRPFQLGMSDKSATALLEVGDNSEMSRLIADAGGRAVEQVTLSSIDDFCEEQGIARVDIIKTDTEGHDLAVLRGAERVLAASVRFVLVEVGMSSGDTRHTSFVEVSAHLAARGFRPVGVYEVAYRPDGTVFYCNALFHRPRG